MNAEIRARTLYKFRTLCRWSPADVAAKLDVSTRTIGLWETGMQSIPDGRWRLFVHEIRAELERRRELVVVLAEDGVTPLDVVSDANFVDLRPGEAAGSYVILSFEIDRLTGYPKIVPTSFKLNGNEHVLHAALHWKPAIQEGAISGEIEMLAVHQWLARRALEAEHGNPKLRELKDKIAAASKELDRAIDAPENVRRQKLETLDEAIFALIREVERSKLA